MSRRGTLLILALAICATLASAWIPAAIFAPGPFIASSVGQNTVDERYQYLFFTRWHHFHSTFFRPQRLFESVIATPSFFDPPPTNDPKATRDRIRAQPMVAGARHTSWPSEVHFEVFSMQEWGLPFRAFWSWRNVESQIVSIRTESPESSGGMFSWQSTALDRASIPYLPLWLGLSANTLIYFITFMAITHGHRAIRSALRRRKGLCPHCRYDLRQTPSNSPCPECGNPGQSEASAQAPAPTTLST